MHLRALNYRSLDSLHPWQPPPKVKQSYSMKIRKLVVLVATLIASFGAAKTLAATAEEAGRQVAVEADKRNTGWAGMTAILSMTLRNAYGQESARSLRLLTQEVVGHGDRSLVVFDEPADLKATVLLTHAQVTQPDDQWMYFPSIKRTKRISSINKSGPFMGSEFAFEDMAPWEVNKYTYKLLGEKTEGGAPVFELEMVPAYANSGYSRQVALIDKTDYRPLRIDYFDRKGALFKTQTYSGYMKYLDKYWRASTMEMKNHGTGKSTMLSWTGYKFRTDLDPAKFEPGALDRPI